MLGPTFGIYLFGEMNGCRGNPHEGKPATQTTGFINNMNVSSSRNVEIQNITWGKFVAHDSISPKSPLVLRSMPSKHVFFARSLRKYSRILTFFTKQKTTDGRTLHPPPSQSEFGRLVQPLNGPGLGGIEIMRA
jgi:hypothetical protein